MGEEVVTQADREAAARFVEDVAGDGFRAGHHLFYRAGNGDKSALVQAFARYRLATANAVRAECAAIVRECAAEERAGMGELTAQRDKVAASNAAHLAESIAAAIESHSSNGDKA